MTDFESSNIKKQEFKPFASKEIVPISDKSFEDWRKFIYDISGIYFQDNKKYLLESRLQKRITFLGLDSYDAYLDYLKYNVKKSDELKFLFEAITINETFFFRNQPQLDALVENIIPKIIKAKEAASPGSKVKIKIWSAASSSGEEAYSIGMILNELIMPKYPNVEFEIVGTDISYAVVETAKKGVYREYSVRNTPPYYLKKYFTINGNLFEIAPQIKKMASFKIMNLFDTMSMRSMTSFDVIFCANVLIYFDTKSKIAVVSNLYNSLNKGGYLFIGYSETLHGVSKAFKLVAFPKTIGYNKE